MRTCLFHQFAAVLLATCCMWVATVCAHQPHDEAITVALSPNFANDGTLICILGAEKANGADSAVALLSVAGGFNFVSVGKGLDNRYVLRSVAFSPGFATDQSIVMTSEGDGAFISHDGGVSWARINGNLPTLSLSVVAVGRNGSGSLVILAAGSTGGVFRTADNGQTWTQVVDSSKVITAIATSPGFTTDGAVILGDASGNVYGSTDRGKTFRKMSAIAGSGPITSIAVSPAVAADRTIFMSTAAGGIFKSVNRGRTFTAVNAGINDTATNTVVISPNYAVDRTLFAASRLTGVYRSTNGGASWDLFNRGIGEADQGTNHFRKLTVSNGYAGDATVFLAAFDGLFVSQDRGESWLELDTRPPSIISGADISRTSANVFTIGVSRYGSGFYRSDDSGQTWVVGNNGLERPYQYDMTLSPNYLTDHTVFTIQLNYVCKSTDGGSTWQLNQISTSKVVFPTYIVVSPAFSSDRTVFIGTRSDGVWKSADGGVTWAKQNLAVAFVPAIVISPSFSTDRTVFVASDQDGIYRTTDGGSSWLKVSSGLTSVDRVKLAISPAYAADQTVFAGTKDGLFKTTDRGANWAKATTDTVVGSGLVETVAVSPNYANDRAVMVVMRGFGLFGSVNAGSTFAAMAPELIDNLVVFKRMLFSPTFALDRTIFAVDDINVWKSADRGQTWIQQPIGVIRLENFGLGSFNYIGQSWDKFDDVRASCMSYSESTEIGDTLLVYFTGTGVSWQGARDSNLGVTEVYVDNVRVGETDQYSATLQLPTTVFSVRDLPYGVHRLEIVASNRKNLASSGFGMIVDALDIMFD